MIQFTVACILLVVAYRNRRNFVQWITAFHKNVQKIKPAVPSLLKLPGISRGNDGETANGSEQPSDASKVEELDGCQSTTNTTASRRARTSAGCNQCSLLLQKKLHVGSQEGTYFCQHHDERGNNSTADLTSNLVRTGNELALGEDVSELTEELLEKLSDSDRDSGVSDDTMLHFSTSEDEILWRGRVREVKSAFEEAAAQAHCHDNMEINGHAGLTSPHRSYSRNLSDTEVMHIKSFLKDKEVKIIDSSGRDSAEPPRKCERPTFLPLSGIYYRRNMSCKSSPDDRPNTPGSLEEKMSPAADVVCWSGPYMEQEQEQKVLRRMSNPFLIKRRVTSKLDTVDRLEKRIQDQQDRINHLLDQIQEKRAAEDFGTNSSTDAEYLDDAEPEMINGNGDLEEETADDLELQLVEERSILRRYQKNLKDALDEIAALSVKIDWGSENHEGNTENRTNEVQMREPSVQDKDIAMTPTETLKSNCESMVTTPNSMH